MKVELVTHTPNPDEVVEKAGRTCYSDKTFDEIACKNSEKFIEGLIKSGHTSVLEHVTFTFAVSGLSRVASHQLVRHRAGFSYSQESLRYVSLTSPSFALPESLKPVESNVTEFYKASARMYKALVDSGYPAEDARYVLPMAVESNIVVTANARALLNFFRARCCNRAQSEIREMADAMLKLCREVAPLMFAHAGPDCVTGKCHESKPCGHPRVDIHGD